MTMQTPHPAVNVGNALLKFLDQYHLFLEKITSKIAEEGLDCAALSHRLGHKKSHVKEVLERHRVITDGPLFSALVEFAHAEDEVFPFPELMKPFEDQNHLIGLASLSGGPVRLAMDIFAAYEQDHGKLRRDEFANLFPHAEIVKRVLRFHRESTAQLISQVATDIETFLCSNDYSKALEAAAQLSGRKHDRQERKPSEKDNDSRNTQVVEASETNTDLLDEYREMVGAILAVYGTKKNAAEKMGIHVWNLSEAEFKKLSGVAKRNVLERLGQSSASRPNEVSFEKRKEPSKSVVAQLPVYEPGQNGIDYASYMLRLTSDILMSFSRISDKEMRRAVRASIEPDVALMLQAIRIHASEYPAETAKMFGGEELLRELGFVQGNS